MHQLVLNILILLFAVFVLVMLAQKIRVAYPIFLVIAGLAISFIPNAPQIHLNPEVIFTIFLPPLLYEAAWYTSWNDLWKWRGVIMRLAFGLVFFTSTVLAYSSIYIIPEFTLALGFLLGGIVSPPDAIAATTVMRTLKVPKRVMTILEGESLVNDAASLIVVKFALAAILTGTFSLQQATGQFFWIAGMGVVIGLAGAHVMYLIHRFLPTTPAIDAALTVMTPYLLYLLAEQYHFSGVMAVVSGGLFISWRSHEIFQTGSTRINMLGVWTTMIFVMNALVFVLIGLSLPDIMEGLGIDAVVQGIKYGLVFSAITISVRYLWVFFSSFVFRLFRKKGYKQPLPDWKSQLIVSFSGMRGVVSLATALSIPLMITEETAFPQRNMIIFISFVVIFVTLVFQGLLLPLVIKWIKQEEIDDILPEDEQQAGIQLRLDIIALMVLHEKYQKQTAENELVALFKNNLEREVNATQIRLTSLEQCDSDTRTIDEYHKVLLDIYSLQRKELFKLRKENLFGDEEIRKAEMQLHLNQLKIEVN